MTLGEDFQLKCDPDKGSQPDADQAKINKKGNKDPGGDDIGKGQTGAGQNKGGANDGDQALTPVEVPPAGMDDIADVID